MATETLMFKDICPTYEKFISNEACNLLRGNVHCYSHLNKLPVLTDFGDWASNIYTLIYAKYKNYQIRYDDEGSFLYDLWLDIIFHTPNYWARKTMYERLMTMSDDELSTQYKNISIFTDHTDSEVDNPLDEVIKSITNQNGSKNTIGIATAVRNYLYHFQYTIEKDYLEKFNHLFIRLYSTANYYI